MFWGKDELCTEIGFYYLEWFWCKDSLLQSAGTSMDYWKYKNLSLKSFSCLGGGAKPPKKPSPRPPEDKRGIAIKPELTKRAKLTGGSTARIRSASVGRDKKSDLQVSTYLHIRVPLRI